MKGYVVRKADQHYAVIYEGLDPVSGRERRRWYPAGPDRAAPVGLPPHRLRSAKARR
ncbi:MAG TPA: hypothetical protein VKD46_02075 [bacterium]|nr:hypothetical protein [bacterium]